eukprot:gene1810-3508_t
MKKLGYPQNAYKSVDLSYLMMIGDSSPSRISNRGRASYFERTLSRDVPSLSHLIERSSRFTTSTKLSSRDGVKDRDDDIDWPNPDGESGTLQVVVISATELARIDLFGKTNPYLVVSFNGEELGQTEVKMKTTTPKWNTGFTFNIPTGKSITDCTLEFSVYHSTGTDSPIFLGCKRLQGKDLIWFGQLGFDDGISEGIDAEDLLILERSESIDAAASRHVKGKINACGRYFPHVTTHDTNINTLTKNSSNKLLVTNIIEKTKNNTIDNDNSLEKNNNDDELSVNSSESKKIISDILNVHLYELKIFCEADYIPSLSLNILIEFNGKTINRSHIDTSSNGSQTTSLDLLSILIPCNLQFDIPLYDKDIEQLTTSKLQITIHDESSNISYGTMILRDWNLYEILHPITRPKTAESTNVDDATNDTTPRRLPSRERSLDSARIKSERSFSSRNLRMHESIPQKQNPFHNNNNNDTSKWLNFYRYSRNDEGKLVRERKVISTGRILVALQSELRERLKSSGGQPTHSSEGRRPPLSLSVLVPQQSDDGSGGAGGGSGWDLSIPIPDTARSAMSRREQFRSLLRSPGGLASSPAPNRPPSTGRRLLSPVKLTSRLSESSLLSSYHLTATEEAVVEQEKHDWEIEYESKLVPEEPVVDCIEGDGYKFTKHLDEITGKFYYYNHINGISTWNKPHTDIAVYLSAEHKELNSTLHWNHFVERKIETIQRQELIQHFKHKYNYSKIKKQELDDKISERDLRRAWENMFLNACKDRDNRGIECSMSWKRCEIHPILFDCEKQYGLKLRSLRLEGMCLESIPDEIGSCLMNLQCLSVSSNKLTNLPDTLTLLSNLTELNAMNNKLNRLPDKIGLMCSLLRLELASNQLTVLPNSFPALTKLDRVVLEKNELTVLPETLDFMFSCRILNLNSNKLIRLPRCIARMPSLTTLSATCNEISYLPRELCFCKNLRSLRLSRNKITMLPDVIGDLSRLTELCLDFNRLQSLPASFYMLTKLITLRLDENEPLVVPPLDVISGGATAVVQWCHDRWMGDEQWRMRFIIATFQKYLVQVLDVMDLVDPSLFEPHVHKAEDTWYAMQLNYMFNDLMPALKQLDREKFRFQFTVEELMWALINFKDANGPLLRYDETHFKRCSCCDKSGRRMPCIPPMKGYMCTRQCALIKDRIVMQADRQYRLWIAYKTNGVEEAVKLAEHEAIKYLDTKDGSMWLQELSFQHAEDAIQDKGVDRIVKIRERKAERTKKDIMIKYDRKKNKIIKLRDHREVDLRRQIQILRDRSKASKGGFVKQQLDKQIDEVISQLANMIENEQLLQLTAECEMKCKAIDDDMLNTKSSSEESSDNDNGNHEVEVEDEDALEEEEDRKIIRLHHEQLKADRKAKSRRDLNGHGHDHDHDSSSGILSHIHSTLTGNDNNHAKALRQARRERSQAKKYAQMRKRLRYAMDAVEIRMHRIILNINGSFNEAQQALEHELKRQYISNCMANARREAETYYKVLGQIRHNWEGLGLDYCFTTWKQWVSEKVRRHRRDLRRKYRNSLREFEAGLACVRIAKLNVDLWDQETDVYTDEPFWVHCVNKTVSWKKPRLEDYVPGNFIIPVPPDPLPEGMALDTSSESEQEDDDDGIGDDMSDLSGDESLMRLAEGGSGSKGEKKEKHSSDSDSTSTRSSDKKLKSHSNSNESSSSSSSSNSDDDGDDEKDEKNDKESSQEKSRMSNRRYKKRNVQRRTSITGVKNSAIKKRLKAVRRAQGVTADSGLQAFLKTGVVDTTATPANATANNMTFNSFVTKDMVDNGAVGMTGTEETLGLGNGNGNELLMTAEELEDAAGRSPTMWKPRWNVRGNNSAGSSNNYAQSLLASTTTSNVAAAANTFALTLTPLQETAHTEAETETIDSTIKSMKEVKFIYGPDSLRVGRRAAGGSRAARSLAPMFTPDPPRDRPSSREMKLIDISQRYVMPTLAAIEQSALEMKLKSEILDVQPAAITGILTSKTSSETASESASAETAIREVGDALSRVQQRRELAKLIRRQTILKQRDRRFDQAPADKKAANKAAELEAERLALEMGDKEFKALKAEQLLMMAGGDINDKDHVASENAIHQRTVLAKKAIHIKRKHEEDAHEIGIKNAPVPKTFYEKHLEHMFKPDRLSSSDEEDENNNNKEGNDTLGELKSLANRKNSTVSKISSSTRKSSVHSVSSHTSGSSQRSAIPASVVRSMLSKSSSDRSLGSQSRASQSSAGPVVVKKQAPIKTHGSNRNL